MRNVKDDSSSDSDEFVYMVNPEDKETIRINGQKVKMVIDTASSKNLIGKRLFNGFFKNSMELTRPDRTFYAYGQKTPLPCSGSF